MACKISTLVIEVYADFWCCKCRKEITRIMCKLQVKEPINTITYDDKNHTVTIAGPFDPDCLIRKIKCKLGKLIKSVKPEEKKEEKKVEKKEEKKEEKKVELAIVLPCCPPEPCCQTPFNVHIQEGCHCHSCVCMSGAGPVRRPPTIYPQCHRENLFPPCYNPPPFWEAAEQSTWPSCSLM